MLAESTNNTKLTQWLNILETLIENKITLLWRSGKSSDIMCADYLSRYIDNARHEHVLIKFSNKLPRLKEEALDNNPNFIPAHYHISDRPITYNELTSLFKTIKQDLPVNALNRLTSLTIAHPHRKTLTLQLTPTYKNQIRKHS